MSFKIPFEHVYVITLGFPGKELRPVNAGDRHKRPGLNPWVGKIPWRRVWQPTPVFLPGNSHRQWSLVGYSLWGHKESDMTDLLSTQAQEIIVNF